jgi:hypothetical protein
MLGANISKKKGGALKSYSGTFRNTPCTISEYAVHEYYFDRMNKRHYGAWTAFPA